MNERQKCIRALESEWAEARTSLQTLRILFLNERISHEEYRNKTGDLEDILRVVDKAIKELSAGRKVS